MGHEDGPAGFTNADRSLPLLSGECISTLAASRDCCISKMVSPRRCERTSSAVLPFVTVLVTQTEAKKNLLLYDFVAVRLEVNASDLSPAKILPRLLESRSTRGVTIF